MAFGSTLKQLDIVANQREELSENLSQNMSELNRYSSELKSERKGVSTRVYRD